MGSSATEVEGLLQAARLHLAQGQFHEAVDRATEVIRQDAKRTAAYLVRAEALRRLKHPDRALADLAVAIRLDPNQPGPYVIRAEILKRRNHFDQAIADATFALTLDPRNAAAFSIRAECRAAIGDQEGASEDVQEMLLIDPTRPMPNLQARTVSTNTDVEMGDERFWKQAGRPDPKQHTDIFADGKPVDKTYRSRPVVSDGDAPEALGVASGYKPETIAKPIPRIRGRSRRSLGNGAGAFLVIGVVIVAVGAIWMVFRGSARPGISEKADSLRPIEVARSNGEEQVPARAETAENAAPPALPPTPALASATEPPNKVGLGDGQIGAAQAPAVDAGAEDRLPALPQGKTWKLAWHDEFDGTTLDAAKWTLTQEMKRKGGWWSPRAVALDGHGHLVIKTYKEGNRFIDGCVSTQGKFEPAFGYYVARVRFPREPGHWPGFWLMSDGVSKVGDGGRDGSEVDIVNAPWRDDRFQHSLHWDGYGTAHKTEARRVNVPGIMEGFHTFGLLWTPEEYVFDVDGQATWRTSAGGVSQVPQYILLSEEVGEWGGDIRQARLPDDFLVDYVRVYELADEATEKRSLELQDSKTKGSSRLDASEKALAQLRISVSKEGECRIILGHAIPGEPKQTSDSLVHITNWFSTRATNSRSGDGTPGSLLVRSSDSKEKPWMIVYPRAFLFPCTLSLDITEFRGALLGVQFVSKSSHLTIHVRSEDGLRENAKLNAACGKIGPDVHATRVERTVQLDRPDELRFQLPLSQEQLAQLVTMDALFFPSERDGPMPSGSISNLDLRARRESPLGLGLKVKDRQVVVERVEPDGLAAAAGVKNGDVLIGINGKKTPVCEDASRLPGVAFQIGIGAEARLTLRRGEEEMEVTIQYR